MRKLVIIFWLGILLSLSHSSLANSEIKSEFELRDECSYDPVGIRECLQKKLKSSELNLKSAEGKVSQYLEKWDEDPDYISAAKAKLKSANEEFVKYREAQCQFALSLGGGAIGNALDVRRFACITELNNRRAEQLLSSIVALPLR
tara:strand:+ start:101 stop:538 length:438 start_codon:yes stop_codon:yes gene_type:complete